MCKTRGSFTCNIGGINTWKTRDISKRVCTFNLFSTCIPRGTINHIPRVFHVAVPTGKDVLNAPKNYYTIREDKTCVCILNTGNHFVQYNNHNNK